MVHSFSPKLCHNLVRVNAQDIQGQVVLFQVNKFEEVNSNKCDHHLHRIGNNCIVTEVGGRPLKRWVWGSQWFLRPLSSTQVESCRCWGRRLGSQWPWASARQGAGSTSNLFLEEQLGQELGSGLEVPRMDGKSTWQRWWNYLGPKSAQACLICEKAWESNLNHLSMVGLVQPSSHLPQVRLDLKITTKVISPGPSRRLRGPTPLPS